MNKKKNLLNLFTQDVKYNYHLINTTEPNGHLIYLIKEGLPLDIDSLIFKQTAIAEELIKECDIKMEKFAPAVFFTDENNTDDLKIKLNFKLYESEDFSKFIEEIKDEYRILEIKDSLLYKKDPDAYNKVKEDEYLEHQKELWGEYMKQIEDKKVQRDETLTAYNNDLIKLLKDYFQSIVEYEKKDFDFTKELDKFLSNFIDTETWIKIDENPFICRADICSLESDKMNVFLTDNNDKSFTATLRFDKTSLITENVIKINKDDELPKIMYDYEILSQLYDVDTTSVKEWDFKTNTEKIEYVIDYLAPIFKEENEKKQKELVEKYLKDNPEESDNQ